MEICRKPHLYIKLKINIINTCLAIMNVLHEGLGESKYRPCPLLAKYVEAGWLGRKTKRGFYTYEN